jgi:hypothetical protein
MNQVHSGPGHLHDAPWPKGLEPPAPPAAAPKQEPQLQPVNFARGNYMASIYQALALLPFDVVVLRAIAMEQHGQAPTVKLTIEIGAEKPTLDEKGER